MYTATDQLQREIKIPFPPIRIISLVPSLTELLYDLGLNEEIVGITKFCVYPKEWKQEKPLVGGTKNINLKKVHALNPDLIIANKEENTKEEIETLAKNYNVWISDVNNLDDALEMIISLGNITNTSEKASEIHTKALLGFKALQEVHSSNLNKKIVYLIWHNPIITVGKNTFIDSMLTQCGFHNIMNTKSRYPELTESELVSLSPEYILLSSEPFPFKEKHKTYYEKLLPHTKVVFVDGEMFSWYGSRLVNASNYFSILANELKDQ